MADPETTIEAQDAWLRLLQVSSRVTRALDVALDRAHRMSVNEFDVLATLSGAPDRGLKMSALAEAVMLSSGGLTRLVGRLEDRGLVRREPCTEDARCLYAMLTEAGSAELARALVTHNAVIEQLIGARLTSRQTSSLEATLAQVLADS